MQPSGPPTQVVRLRRKPGSRARFKSHDGSRSRSRMTCAALVMFCIPDARGRLGLGGPARPRPISVRCARGRLYRPETSGQPPSARGRVTSSPGTSATDLEVVPRVAGLGRGLRLQQVVVLYDPAVLADVGVLDERVVDPQLPHLRRDGLGVLRPRGLDGLEVVEHGAVGAGVHGGRRPPAVACHEAAGPGPRLVGPVPVEGVHHQRALGGLEPQRVQVGDVQDEGRDLALVAHQPELACLLDRADGVARAVREGDHLRAGTSGPQQEGREVLVVDRVPRPSPRRGRRAWKRPPSRRAPG